MAPESMTIAPTAPLQLIAGGEHLLAPRSPVRRILLPTDFSERSLEPLGLASELARAAGAELHLLWVDVLGGSGSGKASEGDGFPSDEDVRAAWWWAGPEALHAKAKGHPIEVVRASERAVEAAPAICSYAFDNDVDLIVMATAAKTGLTRLFLGSVTEQVVRSAPCSVLVVGPECDEHRPSDPPTVLSAVDFSQTSVEAAKLSHDLCGELGARHVVIHVVSDPPVPTFYGLEHTMTPAVWTAITERSEKELAELVRSELGGSESEVRSGGAVSEIVRACDEHGADLLVVGSHGLTGLSRLLLGSVTEKLVRVAPIPVLVVRPAGAEAVA